MSNERSAAADTIRLDELVSLCRQRVVKSVLHIATRRRGGRWVVNPVISAAEYGRDQRGWWAQPHALCGDAPDKYHPQYLMAVLTARAAVTPLADVDVASFPLPQIGFTTDEWVRRSMTLNGMRMCTEYFQNGSLRVLQLVQQRLQAGQHDIVHDVLVYLARQLTDIRSREREARLLRAESVAAYLGLNQSAVEPLFLAARLAPAHVTERILTGVAGPVRRSIDVGALIAAQIGHLRPALRDCNEEERRALELIDQIVMMLRVGLAPGRPLGG